MPIIAIIVGILLIAGIGFAIMTNSEPEIDTTTTDTETIDTGTENTEDATPDTNEQTSTENYTDGEYTAIAQYLTPTRVPHDVTVSITLEKDVITEAEVLFNGNREYDTNQQEQFDQEYKSEVIGVSLDNVKLSRTGGASLTTRAFNDAIETIKTEAMDS